MKEKIWEDVKEILQRHLPDIMRIVKHQYPYKTSAAYYGVLGDYLLGLSTHFLADRDAKKEEYLERSKEIFSVNKRKTVSKVLENLLEELEKYKATVSPDDISNLLVEKRDKFHIYTA